MEGLEEAADEEESAEEEELPPAALALPEAEEEDTTTAEEEDAAALEEAGTLELAAEADCVEFPAEVVELPPDAKAPVPQGIFSPVTVDTMMMIHVLV